MKKRVKICHIIHTLQVGGAEMLLLRICSELLSQHQDAYEFVVIATDQSGPLQIDFEKIGVTVISLNLAGGGYLSCAFHLFLTLLKERPDIVHTHLLPPDKYGQTAAFFALIRHRISTIHNMEPQLSAGENTAIAIVKLFATRIIAVSRSVKENVVTRHGYNSNKISVIHTAPTTSATISSPKRLKLPPSMVNLANVKKSKGHHLIVPAAIAIKKIVPQFTLDILGNADSLFADSIKNAITANNLSANIFLKGTTENPCTLLPRYTCMISLSLFEGFPLAVIEGMSAGLPLILSDIPPHRELLEGIDNVLFVRPDTPDDIAAAFNRLISEPAYYSWLSGKMLERSKNFSIPAMIDKYHAFYQSL